MALFKQTLIMEFFSAPGQPGAVTGGRDGGWSESAWSAAAIPPGEFQTWAATRAALLPADCAVIGWRQTPLLITGNRIQPQKSQSGALFAQGIFNPVSTDPETALLITATANAVPASFTYFLHALPYLVISSNCYVPTRAFSQAFTRYATFMTAANGGVPSLWLGRDQTQLAQQVQAINPILGTITTSLPIGVAVNDWIRLRRVYAGPNQPVKGTFQCTAVVVNANGSATYTVLGLPPLTVTRPSGTARKDLIATSPINSFVPREVGDRKIGRPSKLFRGRRPRVNP